MFARTRRLTLRPGWPEDAAALTRAIAHEAVAMKLSRLPWPYGVAEARAWLETPHALDEPSLLILSHERDYPRVIGGIGLHRVGAAHEIGYWLTPAAWGRGYATEAGHAMVHAARRTFGLTRLVSGHFVDNPASGRVLAKLGFRETGREPRFCLARGHDVECVTLERDLDDEARTGTVPLAA